MLYKFMGGSENDLLRVFDLAVAGGSIKFTPISQLNDLSEFAFSPVAPTREQFEEWHCNFGQSRTSEEMENAWQSFSEPAKEFNTAYWPRMQLMHSMEALCLSRRWDSNLMWAHYASSHIGFAIAYHNSVVEDLNYSEMSVGHGDVIYSDSVPELRWFSDPPRELAKILATKSSEWAYEQEYRVVRRSTPGAGATFVKVDARHIAGIILGSRASSALIANALAFTKITPEFFVEQISSGSGGFELTSKKLAHDSYPSSLPL